MTIDIFGGEKCTVTSVLSIRVLTYCVWHDVIFQSELPRPNPQNSVESEHGCIHVSTSRIYFDNAGDNVTLSLYNVTLTSQRPC